jgi:parallel beta-helix repeat protein
MKKNISVIGISILFLLLSLIPLSQGFVNNETGNKISNGFVFYVGGYGPGNYTKIQDAIDNASDGDTVFVFSGTYNERPYVNKSINLQGENKLTTKINGMGRGDVILCEADNIIIHGFTLNFGTESSGRWWTAGIQMLYCNFCSIFDNIIMDNFHGIRINYGEGNTITNNIISSNHRRGIWAHELCYDTIISNNTIENNGYSGIHIDGSDGCIVNDNVVNYNTDEGILIDHSAYNTISNNELRENNYNGIVIWISNDNHIISNKFYKNGLRIEQDYSYNNFVEDNFLDDKPLVFLENKKDRIIDDAGQVFLLNCKNITIKDLNISNVYYGILIVNTKKCVITNCTIHDNFGAIYLGYKYPNVSENITVTNNKIFNNQKGIFFWNTYHSIITNNLVDNNTLFGINVSGKNYEIRGNTIQGNFDGLYIKGANHNISGNIIDRNIYGFFAVRLIYSKLSENEITLNGHPVLLVDSNYNKIYKNNIYRNYNDAYHRNSLLNKWRCNFWKKKNRIGPKVIRGELIYYPGHWQPPRIIPVFRLDIFPARYPYNFRGGNV